MGCVSQPVTGLCPWTKLAGGCEAGVWCDLKPLADSIWGRPKPGLVDFSVTSFSEHEGLVLPGLLACCAAAPGMASVALCFLSLVVCSLGRTSISQLLVPSYLIPDVPFAPSLASCVPWLWLGCGCLGSAPRDVSRGRQGLELLGWRLLSVVGLALG